MRSRRSKLWECSCSLWGRRFLQALAFALTLGGAENRSTAAEQVAPATAAAEVPGLVPITNLVRIKPGAFVRIRQSVTLTRDYWLGKFEVTQEEFTALMGSNPSNFKDGPAGRPVEKVTFEDAVGYCAALTARERQAGRLPMGYAYRLPTEAEWEFACRGGTTNRFSFGDDPAAAEQYAWTLENSGGATHPVGQKLPNPLGLHDLHGNVWEWCADWYADYPAGAVTDPVGPSAGKGKVFRGGGWNNEVAFARSSNRFAMTPKSGIYFVGFRVALGSAAAPAKP